MPAGVVKTKRDEHKWSKAKDLAEEAGFGGNYAYVMGIYKRMKPDYEFKSAVSRVASLWNQRWANPSKDAEAILGHLLATLRAGYQNYQTAHWQSKGPSFYGDHLLFQRIYDSYLPEIDALAEKMIAMFGNGSVDQPQQSIFQAFLAKEWALHEDAFKRAYHVEKYVQEKILNAYDSIKDLKQMTLGLDDFLMSMSNAHEGHQYLIGQRIGDGLSAMVVKAASNLRYRVSLFTDEPGGKPVWTKVFSAPDDARADVIGLALVKPELNKHPDAEDWVVEPVGHRGKKAHSNAKVIEAPHSFHAVKVEPPQAKRAEFPFEGFIDFQGIKIDVENVMGSVRRGTGPEGDWQTYMHAHYGEIRGTEGTDGDKLDVYVGPNHDSSIVLVVHQHNPWDGKYDEDKVVLGCDSLEEAIGSYKKQYDRPGFFRDGEYTAMPIGAFWRWVHDKNNKGKKVKLAAKEPFPADHSALYAEVYDKVLRRSALPVWTEFRFSPKPMQQDVGMRSFTYEVLWPDFNQGVSGLRLRVPGDSAQYTWSPRSKKWFKSRVPLEEVAPEAPLKDLDSDQKAFYRMSPADIMTEIHSIPKSLLRHMVFIRELLPPVALAYLKSQGID